MYSRILVAYDGSDPAARALDLALALADKFDAAIRVLAVARPPDFGQEVETKAAVEDALKHYRHLLKPIKERGASQARAVEVEAVVGHPAERIVIAAEQWKAELIIIGHRGHGLAGRWLLGSVAKQVMHHATCDVLVTHPRKQP
jgi:nucleotide-binding universal stress UspA family protein